MGLDKRIDQENKRAYKALAGFFLNMVAAGAFIYGPHEAIRSYETNRPKIEEQDLRKLDAYSNAGMFGTFVVLGGYLCGAVGFTLIHSELCKKRNED
ncbi:hypothetical protein HYT23_04700 [Candidatus Pacearchaeota archaeon]|nr:hypothetical protein [Candidatus Pacearchaeota archaeon]